MQSKINNPHNAQSPIYTMQVEKTTHHKHVQCQESPYQELIYTPTHSANQNQIESQSTINLNSMSPQQYNNINTLLFEQTLTGNDDRQSIGGRLDEAAMSPTTMSYKQLQDKIQSALRKNTLDKNFANSTLMKSNFTTQTLSQFNQALLNRFQIYEQNKTNAIQLKKYQNQVKQSQSLKFRPQINSKSLKIVQQMGGHQPIEQRYQKLLDEKNKRIQQYEQFKKRKDQQQYKHFLQQFERHQKTHHNISRSPEQFYEQMLKWKENSVKSLQQKKKVIEQKQIEQNNNFKPRINKKSKNILLSSSNNQLKIPIYERQAPGQKKFKMKIDEQCTFKPRINKRRIK